MTEREGEFWLEIKNKDNTWTVVNINSSSELDEMHTFFDDIKGDLLGDSKLIKAGSTLEYKEHNYRVEDIVVTLYKSGDRFIFGTVLRVEKM
jgi:hypothetical protein